MSGCASRSNKHQQRGFRRRKTAMVDENIDRQILVIHQAIMAKLARQPDRVEQVKLSIEEKMEQGHPKFKSLRNWWFILEGCRDIKELTEAVLEDSSRLRQLRRHTPFTGILTETERQQALHEAAAGTLSHVIYEL